MDSVMMKYGNIPANQNQRHNTTGRLMSIQQHRTRAMEEGSSNKNTLWNIVEDDGENDTSLSCSDSPRRPIVVPGLPRRRLPGSSSCSVFPTSKSSSGMVSLFQNSNTGLSSLLENNSQNQLSSLLEKNCSLKQSIKTKRNSSFQRQSTIPKHKGGLSMIRKGSNPKLGSWKNGSNPKLSGSSLTKLQGASSNTVLRRNSSNSKFSYKMRDILQTDLKMGDRLCPSSPLSSNPNSNLSSPSSHHQRKKQKTNSLHEIFKQDMQSLLTSLHSDEFVGTIHPQYHARYVSDESMKATS